MSKKESVKEKLERFKREEVYLCTHQGIKALTGYFIGCLL